MNTIRGFIVVVVVTLACMHAYAQEQPAAGSNEQIAKQLANPLSTRVTLPFQSNVDYGIGTFHGARYVMNFQPIVPISLSKKVLLVIRPIIPVIDQNSISGEGRRESGIGDAVTGLYFSPAHPKNGFIWGLGPALQAPTSTSKFLGVHEWAAGPTAVVLKQVKSWTYGFLTYQVWSFAGDAHADVNKFYFQTFLVYNWKSGAGVNLASESTFNWQTRTNIVFLIPVISGVTKLGKQVVSLSVGPRIAAIGPDSVRPDFGLRGVITLVFPTANSAAAGPRSTIL